MVEDAWITRNLPRLHEELFEMLRMRSVSTAPERAADVRSTADWLADRCRRAGLEATLEETEGHPLVVARHHAGDDRPTLLVYGHYDVQPAEPLEEWTSPPWEPTVRDGRLYARGAADDKSQVFLQVAAAEAALATGTLPVNLLLVFEGEEEVGSVHLVPFVKAHREELAADHVLIADSMMFAPGRPSLIFGMRGIAYFEIMARIGSHDLHSGQYGGAVANPANAMARVLASLHAPDGRVAVRGFYDDVAETPPELREEWRGLGYDEEAYRRSAGGAALVGEPGYTTAERLWIRPTLDVNGLLSGYTGPGKKTVLPATAMAKLSCRLVPDQDPARIGRLLREHIERVTPEGVALEVRQLQGNRPWRDDPSAPLYEAARRALRHVFRVEPVRVAHGGSLPIAREFADILGAHVAVMGFADPMANMHAPDESFPLEHVEKGMRTMVRLYRELAAG